MAQKKKQGQQQQQQQKPEEVEDPTLPTWYYDLTNTSSAMPMGQRDIPAPPGFGSSTASKKSSANSTDNSTTLVKKAWELALAPAKSLPMNLFVSYMSGNSLQIVPIMMTSMMFFINPLKQIWSANSQFEPLTTKSNASDITLTKYAFILCQLLAVVAGVWKLGQMGLLPNTRSDWLAWESPTIVSEKSV